MRVGGNDPIPVDVRVIAATNRRPEEAVERGQAARGPALPAERFPIQLPPLRERGEDIELLAEHFLDQLNKRGRAPTRRSRGAALAAPARARLAGQRARAARTLVQRAFILADEQIGADCLPLDGAPTPVAIDGLELGARSARRSPRPSGG